MDLLQTEVEDLDGWLLVRVRGQLDLGTVPELRQVLVEATYRADGGLAVDLDGLEFMDAIALGVILEAVKRSRAHGRRFAIVCRRESALETLEQTRLAEILDVVGSVEGLPQGPGATAAGR